jgi:hypothetical protein
MGPLDQYQQGNQRYSFQFGPWSRCSATTRNPSWISEGAHFNAEDQPKARELNSNLLEEKCNIALANIRKYQESLKRYYNKSVVQRELDIRDIVLRKDQPTKDKHKFSSPWEGPFIVVDIAAPGAYVLVEVDGDMLPNIWNAD